MVRYKRSFASDNNAVVHPKIMEALQEANNCHVLSYGEDHYTESARERFREVLERTARYSLFLTEQGPM